MSKLKRRGVLASALLVTVALAFAGVGAATSTHKSDCTLTIGWIADMSGAYASYQGQPIINAATAAFDAQNAKGGVNGCKINMKVYDTQSTPAGGVAAVRKAISDKVFAVLTTSGNVDSSLQTLLASGIPGFAPGDSPSWIGTTHKTLFPYEGNLSTQNTTAWFKWCVDRGRTNIAIPAGSTPGAATYVQTWVKDTKAAGGNVVFAKAGIDTSNSAAIQALAQQLIDAKANCVVSLVLADPQLQAALNQLAGAGKVWVVSPSAFGTGIIQQFGSSVNGLVYANFFASLAAHVKGVQEYLADMKKYEPKADPENFAVKAYATAKWFMYNLGRVKGTPTGAAISAVAEHTNGWSADGLVPPVYFPLFHTMGQVCLGYSQIVNGKWVAAGNNASGFVCGKEVGSS